jgi:hypothetical protein
LGPFIFAYTESVSVLACFNTIFGDTSCSCCFILQLYADIAAVCNESSELNIDDVLMMRYLLATVYESACLLPAGPFLQRCSLKHGKHIL